MSENVEKQYRTSGNLKTRISIHEKYSTNKTGFGNWIFSNYNFTPNCSVLELGCGTGSMWVGRDAAVKMCSRLVLSDLSEGMLAASKENLAKYSGIEYKIADIQSLPFEDGSFDMVMANMMLYHVPDIGRALREVRRVLKIGGHFYCATFGEHGIIDHLSSILSKYGVRDETNKKFTLQNGAAYLKTVFGNVERLDYEDSLAVTNVDDMIDYLYSLDSMTSLNQLGKDDIRAALIAEMTDGVLQVPKEYGMFICS